MATIRQLAQRRIMWALSKRTESSSKGVTSSARKRAVTMSREGSFCEECHESDAFEFIEWYEVPMMYLCGDCYEMWYGEGERFGEE